MGLVLAWESGRYPRVKGAAGDYIVDEWRGSAPPVEAIQLLTLD